MLFRFMLSTLALLYAECALDPFVFDEVKSESGYVPIHPQKNSSMFYWYLPHEDPKAPLVIWLQGGPGVSSMLGAFYEIGPYAVENGQVVARKNHWGKLYNLVFVDSPVGVGFSPCPDPSVLPKTSEDVARDFRVFLLGFFAAHPSLRANDFYITGEDYAGHMIPPIAYVLMKEPLPSGPVLKGIAIGNGHTHPPIQVITKPESASFFGLIDDGPTLANARVAGWTASVKSISGDFMGSLEARNELERIIVRASNNVNMGDIRLQGQYNMTLFPVLDEILNSPLPKKSVGATNNNWQYKTRNVDVFNSMQVDVMMSVWQYIPPLLDEGKVKALFFMGQFDWIDGFYSNEAWISAMQWSGNAAYRNTSRTMWSGPRGENWGYTRSVGPLTVAMVRNAGHMAAMDQPDAVMDLVQAFIAKPYTPAIPATHVLDTPSVPRGSSPIGKPTNREEF